MAEAPVAPPPAPASPEAPLPAEDRAARLAEERRALVEACVEIVGRLRSTADRRRLEQALAEAGVHPVSAEGERFDPDRHHAVGAQATDDDRRLGEIARTQRPGYVDGEELLRAPEVVVFERDHA